MKRLIPFLFIITLIPSLYSWSPSHKRILKELDDYVPFLKEKLSVELRKQLIDEYYNLPDKQVKQDSTLVSEASVEYLKSVNIYNSLTLHQAEALPHMYYLLVNSLKRRSYKEAVIWIACISHNLNDSASPHYIPGIYAFEQLRRNFNVTANGKKVVDYNNSGLFVDPIFNRPEGIKLLKKFKKTYKFKSLGSDPENVSVALAKLPFYLRNASFKHAEYLLDNIQRNVFSDKPQIYNGNVAVAKMAIIGMSATADVLNTAWETVENRTRYKSEDINMEKVNKAIDELIKERKLEHMPIYHNVLPEVDSGSIGILAEPYYRFDASCLGFASRILSASIMGTLKKNNKSYRAINLLDVVDKKLPSPKEMPVLIIPACEVTLGYRWIKKRHITNMIRDYTAEGGKVLWISSSRVPHLGELSFSMKELSETDEFKPEVMNESYVYASSIMGIEGRKETVHGIEVNELKFKVLPDYKLEWIKIVSPLHISNDDGIEPLIFYKTDFNTYTVAAYEKDTENKGKANFICVSSLFFFPNLFNSEYQSAIAPQLDPNSEKMLETFLKLL